MRSDPYLHVMTRYLPKDKLPRLVQPPQAQPIVLVQSLIFQWDKDVTCAKDASQHVKKIEVVNLKVTFGRQQLP